MRLRPLAVGLLVGALALTACGREGSPTDNAAGGSPAPSFTPASDVKLDGSPTFERIKGRDQVVIGVKEDQPQLGYKDPTSGKYTGFDIEIARMIAAKLGYGENKIQFKAVASVGREQAIANGEVDYYVGTYTINDKRKEQISFAGPYYVAGQDLLVRRDDTSITGKDSLKGKKVCSATGSTPLQRVTDQQLTEPNNIVSFQNYSQCVQQLDQKQVDAVTTDDAILKGYAALESNKFRVVGNTFSTEPYGVGLAKDDKVLRDKINDVLQESFDNGTWQQIYDSTLGKSGAKAEKPQLDRY